jgi:hypothetical protein
MHIADLNRLHGDPHGLVFSSKMRCNSPPSVSRSVIICARSCRPIDSRSAVWALNPMASLKSATSRMDFSAFHTSQNTMASTFTGTASRVKGRFGFHLSHADALVYESADAVNHRYDHEKTWPVPRTMPIPSGARLWSWAVAPNPTASELICVQFVQIPNHLGKLNSFRPGLGQKFAAELTDSTLAFQAIDWRPLVCQERSRALLRRQHLADFKFAIRPHDGVRIDRQFHRELPHRRQLIARVQLPGRNAAQDLIDNLPVSRHSAALIQRELGSIHVPIRSFDACGQVIVS